MSSIGLTPSTRATCTRTTSSPRAPALGLGSVRFHDLRHTFATMNLCAGEHYMQVSKWLGHSSFVLTLSTYADYINEDELAAPKGWPWCRCSCQRRRPAEPKGALTYWTGRKRGNTL